MASSFISAQTKVPSPAVASFFKKFVDAPFSCPCGTTHQVFVKDIQVGSGVVSGLPEAIKKNYPASTSESFQIGLVTDRRLYNLYGRKLVEETMRDFSVSVFFPLENDDSSSKLSLDSDESGPRPLCNDENEAYLIEAVSKAGAPDLFISLGGGTSNDLTKLMSWHFERPYVTMPTVPSMNGYTSNIVAFIDKGLKITRPCPDHLPYKGPDMIWVDVDFMKTAPSLYTKSGFGDMLSKGVAGMDWSLAHHLLGVPHCPAPDLIVGEISEAFSSLAPRLPDPSGDDLIELTWLLILSGYAMSVVGSSSPASGGEHLVSHYWDMKGVQENNPRSPHGIQVAAGSLLSTFCYEVFLDLLNSSTSADELKAESVYPSLDREAWVRELASRHGWASDTLKKKICDQASEKFYPQGKALDPFGTLFEKRSLIVSLVKKSVPSVAQMAGFIKGAGIDIRPEALYVTEETHRQACLYSHEIRNRFTVYDVLQMLGKLEGVYQSYRAFLDEMYN